MMLVIEKLYFFILNYSYIQNFILGNLLELRRMTLSWDFNFKTSISSLKKN